MAGTGVRKPRPQERARRRGARSESKASEDPQLRRLLDAVADGAALCREGRVVWANAALAELAGRAAPAELEGQPFDSLFEDVGSGRPGPGVAGAVPCRMARSDRAVRNVSVECARDGPEKAVAFIVRDRTREAVLEAEALRSSRQLAAANREREALRERLRRETVEREELLTIVSHELRTPITVISGYNRLLLSEKTGPLNAQQQHYLLESQRSCQRLNAFVGNLLEAARESAGSGPLDVCDAPLAPAVEATVAQLEPLWREHGLRVVLDIDPEAPSARFDPRRIEQVLVNVLGNAIKFAPAGGTVEVSVRGVRRGSRLFLEVSVSDEGPGVEPGERKRIFEPYAQAGESRGAGGLGLGLAICRRIVEAHGGEIGVTERSGGGSRFVFTVPAAQDTP